MKSNQLSPELTAFQVRKWDVPIVPAPLRRDWMSKGAYHCLPMTMANQYGWLLLLTYDFTAVWDGSKSPDGVTISIEEQNDMPKRPYAHSHFGLGTITFDVPFLFRTSPGYDLVVKGPSNFVRPNAQGLEGLIEADWAPMTFTMNWKIHLPDHPVTFRKDEPFCMIYPRRREELEEVNPEIRQIDDVPEEKEGYQDFLQKRLFNRAHNHFRKHESENTGSPKKPGVYDHDYLRGHPVDEVEQPFEEHRRRLDLKPFKDRRSGKEA